MKLRDWRAQNNLTGDELGELCGIGGHSIRAYERGDRLPRPDIARRLELVTGGAVTAAELLGLSSKSGFNEEPADIVDDVQTDGSSSTGKTLVELSIPKRMLEYADELGVDAEAFVMKGGLPALDAELRRVFYEQNAEAMEVSRKRIAENGTFGQRFGVYRFQ
tara:strand:- start:29402 stop:29890 length:489 start_codon:yes stop_codon:yes gene_type:complete